MSHQRLTALCLFATAYQIIAVTRNVDGENRSYGRSTLIRSDVPPGYHVETMREVRKHYSPGSYRFMSYDEARRTGVLDRMSRVGGGGGGAGKRNGNVGKRRKRRNGGNDGTARKGDDKRPPPSDADDQTPVSEHSARPSAETPANVPQITAPQPVNSGP